MTAESNLISAVCTNKDISVLYAENVDDLFVAHHDVWQSVKNYYDRYKAVPTLEFLEKQHAEFEPERVTGETEFYLDELKNEFVSSRIRQISLKASQALKAGVAPGEVLDKTTTTLAKLGKFTNNVRDVDITDFAAAEKHFAAVQERSAALGSPGIPTTFKSIDSVYPTGMAPGHLIVAIGWPGKGKTWFTSYLACKAWEQGFKPMIVSLEMSPENMRDRIYTMMGSGLFRASDFAKGDVNIDDFHAWGKRRFDNRGGFVVVSNEGLSDVTPNTVQAKIDQHKPDLVICDYHQLFQCNSKSNSPTERGMAVSREFKMLAVTNNIPLIDITAATQSDLSDRDSPPMMSQVAWSKAIEYDADMAFAVHRHDDSDLVEIVCRKNRHGSMFDFYLDWDIDRGIVTEKFSL
ncbi:DnaB-like dsDNA helicase [Streptomyces phage TunaTartare]|uniref:DnaB-like dsDNA helicase n=1 Tax=Streptomyces phage TunaTartare TaxID=2848887 RepID=A0A8F2IWH5_9CAUD|nr:DnaB-like replicative helicase [Streptomyces phage TunaTartare]QWT29946.1 DnaB-like dsDNA helicase [Streptomyces phage TunaTartare]